MPKYEYPEYRISIEAESKEEADKALQAEIENGNVTPILEENTASGEAESKEEADTQSESIENTSPTKDTTSTPKRNR